jgi:hypothetical protein
MQRWRHHRNGIWPLRMTTFWMKPSCAGRHAFPTRMGIAVLATACRQVLKLAASFPTPKCAARFFGGEHGAPVNCSSLPPPISVPGLNFQDH